MSVNRILIHNTKRTDDERKTNVLKTRDMLRAGYKCKVVEKRVHSSMRSVRDWAKEFNILLR